MANGHGGARPGAGRKRKETVEHQASRRSVVLEVFEEEEWREIMMAWRELSKTMPSVIYPLLPYILGGAKQEINVTGTIEHVELKAARQLLRVVGGTDS